MVRIRLQQAGDLGWVFMRQAEIYANEFGYSPVFERYVCQGLAPFMENHDATLDRLWIAQEGDRRVGAIAIQHDRPGWAKLRWFLVEPDMRGKGLGRQLMQEALGFCKQAGYEGVLLWTVNDLHAARKVYEASGFRLAFQDETPCPWAPWGHEQRWELLLTDS